MHLFDPVLHEHRLQGVHRRTFDAHGSVSKMTICLHGWEECTVLKYGDGIAVMYCTVGEAREGSQAFRQWHRGGTRTGSAPLIG